MKSASAYFAAFVLFLTLTHLSPVFPQATQGITTTTSQISTSSITNSKSYLQDDICRCNLIASICDDKCCCDTQCPASYIATWKARNQCTNQEFIYSSSSINLCSTKRPKTIDDLRSGLRIYYQILKIFFCVAIDHSKMTDRYKDYQSGENVAEAIAVTQPTSTSSASSNTVQSQSTVSSTNYWADYTIARPGFGSSLCSSRSIKFNNNLESKDCYQTAATLSAICQGGTALDPEAFDSILTFRVSSSSSSTITLTVRNIRLNNPKTIGYTTGATSDLNSPSWTTDATDTTKCICSNFLSEIHYQLVLNSNNQITAGYVDLVITTSQTYSCANPRVKQTTSLYFTNEQITVPRLKGPGYRLDDPILIGVSTTNTATGLSIITAFAEPPLSLNYINNDGECAMTTDEVDPKGRKSLEFGSNHVFSCDISKNLADLQTFCSSTTAGPGQVQMYANIETNFKYLAQFPNANPSYISDWVSAGSFASSGSYTGATQTCIVTLPRISIFYSKIGTQMNPGYKINSISISQDSEKLIFTLSDSTAAQTFNLPLYVNFIPLPQSPDYFVAPAPTVNVKLPDNVLTPFIRSRS